MNWCSQSEGKAPPRQVCQSLKRSCEEKTGFTECLLINLDNCTSVYLQFTDSV